MKAREMLTVLYGWKFQLEEFSQKWTVIDNAIQELESIEATEQIQIVSERPR